MATNYAEAFSQAYNAAIGNSIAAALQTLGFGPTVPPAPTPVDVLPEPTFREVPASPPIEGDYRVLYDNILLPGNASPEEINTLLAMGGNMNVLGASQTPPADRVLLLDAYGGIVPPGTDVPLGLLGWPGDNRSSLVEPLRQTPPGSPPPPEPFLPPLPIGFTPLPDPFAPITSAGLSLLPEVDMSLLSGATKFFGSNLGQSLAGALVSRLTAGSSGFPQAGLLTGKIITPSVIQTANSITALPGAGFTTGRGFGTSSSGRAMTFGRKRRRMNPMNVHALRRSLRRVEGFVKLEKRVDKIVRRLAPVRRTAARKGFVKRR